MTVLSAASAAASVNSWRMRRARPAPTAVRTRISPRRDAAWATRRFATFAHASSSSRVTAPKSARTASLNRGLIIHSLNPTASALHPLFVSGEACAQRRDTSRSSPAACSGVAPGASRAITASALSPWSAFGSARSWTHASASAGKSNPGGITPVTVSGLPSTLTTRPTMPVDALKRERHRPSESTIRRSTTPGPSSSAVNMRPSCGRTPRTSTSDADTGTALMASGSPPSASTAPTSCSR